MLKIILIVCAAVILFGCHSANAGSTTATASVNKIPAPLKIVTTGLAADCGWAPGALVMTMSATGGDGKAIVYTIGGTPSGDFAISGNTVVVGPNGIAAANCGVVETLSIIATQP